MTRVASAALLMACATLVTVGPAPAAAITPESINQADYAGGALPDGQSAVTARAQVLLDRNHASPGVIDGRLGSNLATALTGFETMHGLDPDGVMDEEVWNLLSKDAAAAIVRYRISEDDLSGIVAPLPEDYAELAEREHLGYTSVEEKIAERFHIDVDFLRLLNPGADFAAPGAEIWVTDPGETLQTEVARISVDNASGRLFAHDGDGTMLAVYPATVGSTATPSPSGTHEVRGVAIDPNYTYKPDENFTQGSNTEPLVLPPGPNGPVGNVWIDLSEPTYGIHGTAEPAEIDKVASHGCVRMTNWDATELAGLVSAGVRVEFQE